MQAKDTIIVFDFDSTVVSVESLEVLAEYALRNNPNKEAILTEMKYITNLGMDGSIPYEESLSRRMPLLSLTKTDVETFAPKMCDYITESFRANADFLREHAHNIYIVSGGFDDLIFPVADALHIPRSHVFSNDFTYDEAGAVTGVDTRRHTSRKGGKAEQLRTLNVTGRVVMVGDGMTDYEARKQGVADVFVAYTEHAERAPVVAVADTVARSFEDIIQSL